MMNGVEEDIPKELTYRRFPEELAVDQRRDGGLRIVHQDVALTGYAFLPPGLPASGGVVATRVTWVVEKRGGSWEIVFQQMTPRL